MRVRYSVFNRGSYALSAICDHLAGRLGEPDLLDAALRVALRRTGVALNHVQAAHQNAGFLRPHLGDRAFAALVLAGEDHDAVPLLDLRGHHSTSGASEMIFMWFLARSAR